MTQTSMLKPQAVKALCECVAEVNYIPPLGMRWVMAIVLGMPKPWFTVGKYIYI